MYDAYNFNKAKDTKKYAISDEAETKVENIEDT